MRIIILICTIVSVILSITLIGCGDDPYASANDRTTSSALEAQQEIDHNPEELMAPMEEVEPEPVNPCARYGRYSRYEVMDESFVDSIFNQDFEHFVAGARECDNHGRYFTVDGRVVDEQSEFLAKGMVALENIQAVTVQYSYLGNAFESLPVLKRREVLEPAMNALAPYVIEYIHPDLIRRWLLDLKWTDIESVDPDWYRDTEWPRDRTEPVNIEGYGEISKIELWVKMFWKRRGELIFTTAQNAIKAAQKSSVEAPTGS